MSLLELLKDTPPETPKPIWHEVLREEESRDDCPALEFRLYYVPLADWDHMKKPYPKAATILGGLDMSKLGQKDREKLVKSFFRRMYRDAPADEPTHRGFTKGNFIRATDIGMRHAEQIRRNTEFPDEIPATQDATMEIVTELDNFMFLDIVGAATNRELFALEALEKKDKETSDGESS